MRLPLDKSWIKCLTIQEMRGVFNNEVSNFLNNFPDNEMPDDIKACRDVLNIWHTGIMLNEPVYFPVRNNRSLTIALDCFLKTKKPLKYEFIMGKQLSKRKLYDNKSSQYITGNMLVSNLDIVNKEWCTKGFDKMPYHTKIAYDSLISYQVYKEFKIIPTIYKEDFILRKQFIYFIKKLQGIDFKLKIDSAEDVPLAVAFGEITIEEAVKKYPQLRNHETDRIEEMKFAFTDTCNHSKDHRIVMARAMKDVIDGNLKPTATYINAVDKSFPKFWEYLDEIRMIYK